MPQKITYKVGSEYGSKLPGLCPVGNGQPETVGLVKIYGYKNALLEFYKGIDGVGNLSLQLTDIYDNMIGQLEKLVVEIPPATKK